ncbi:MULTISPECIES: helix-turn-helix domain-containing protein [unclassified Aureimonas]|uniref:helix-turn-helix domain-containing protein n=1 Tax=unclassified Aureimonas TaxID=2615206 RepID=UPI0009E77618|nr:MULTISPECIES: AraC family transcriptional regulator [unclassified Aureimonas]
MTPSLPTVFSSLSASPSARVLQRIDLGSNRSAAIWANERDRMSYERPDGHTISLYLAGGTGTRRLDIDAAGGWPGALCVMPQGQSSEWDITDAFRFVHLYIPDDQARRVFAETFDRDARMMVMPEVTFGDAPVLAPVLRDLAAATLAGDPLRAETAGIAALVRLYDDPRYGGAKRDSVRGGLAPHLCRRLRDHIEADLHRTIRLEDLARLAQLSEFHFQRMFRASFGVSPHAFVGHRRILRARSLLKGLEPIAEIAAACGYSSQSHLTRAFRAATGLTPGAYRHRLGESRPGTRDAE